MPIYAKLAVMVVTKTAEFSLVYLLNLTMFQFMAVWGMDSIVFKKGFVPIFRPSQVRWSP
ncbi:hypothetical protein DVG78_13175 [Runella aurantiaca]|uniref:Uncharacterized protein n=1 Tax=Runella aurantiaca TaxID=2282308 RepID=A0A369I9H2_9BACT|nr:hypothetical protein DVG78_13175 [Runella aurantiaca]